MKHSRSELSGILLMLQASFCFSIMALCVKILSHSLPSYEIVFFRSFTSVLLISYFIKKHRVSFLGTHRGIMILRGLSGFIALILFFSAIAELPLGTAVMLNYTAPFFTAIFAMSFLREPFSFFLIAMTLVAFGGVSLLVEGEFSAWNPAIFIGLLSAMFAGIAYVLIRFVKHRESPLTIMFYFTAISTIGSLCLFPMRFAWPTLTEWLIISVLGITAFYGQLWLTIALRRARASLVSAFSYTSPLLCYLYGVFFFGDVIEPKTAAGVFIIIAASILISYRGTLRKQKS